MSRTSSSWPTGPHADSSSCSRSRRMPLLVGFFPLLRGLGAAARRLGLGLFLSGVLLGVGLVLLGLALVGQVVASGDRSRGFLGLSLDVFDGALDALLRAAVLSHAHSSFVEPPKCSRVRTRQTR